MQEVDGPLERRHLLDFRREPWGSWFALAALVALSGCQAAQPAVIAPVADAGRVASQIESATRIPHPQRLVFRWRLAEAGIRFRGRGVARMEPPYRVRLDLFTTGGETLFQAAMVGQDLRIPPWAPRELAPPPALMWASMGVFRPDSELELVDGLQLEEGGVLLKYGAAEGRELWFRVVDGRLTGVEIRRSGHVTKEVELAFGDSADVVQATTYRDREAFRELEFELESIEQVESFPPDIWLAWQ
jgi:hypothetical protein